MPSSETLKALGSGEFLTGLAFGFAALLVGVLVSSLFGRNRDRPVSLGATLLVLASAGALEIQLNPPSRLWIGLVALSAAGAVYRWTRRSILLTALLTLPGAWWVTSIVDLPGADWVGRLLFVWIVVAAPLMADFDSRNGLRTRSLLLLLVTIGGMFSTLPDTEQILPVLGAGVPIVALAWLRPPFLMGAPGVFPMLGLLAWVIAVGGVGRESSVIGATAAVGLFVVEPVARCLASLVGHRGWREMRLGVIAALFSQLGIVLVVARVAGRMSSLPAAAAVALAVLVVGTAVVAFSPRPTLGRTGATDG